jgi:ribosomal protein S8E
MNRWLGWEKSDIVVKGSVVQIEVDEDGEVESVKLLKVADSNYYLWNTMSTFKTDASYVAGLKLAGQRSGI